MSIIKDHGICKLSVVPVRAEATDESEIVTQLLFGDYVKVLAKGEPWIKIYFPADDYEGWMDFKQLKYVDERVFELGVNQEHRLATLGTVQVEGPLGLQHIMFGSNLPGFNGDRFFLDGDEYIILHPLPEYNKTLVETALLYLNTPYLWGGKGIFGIDCSGFTQIVAKIHGKKLPRDASQQVNVGETIKYEERQIGDLMYFINKSGKVHHVGIVTGDEEIIHASGHVRIDKFDEKGIYRKDLEKYTHNFHSIKRI